MPLQSGGEVISQDAPRDATASSEPVTLAFGPHVGAALRAAREQSGLSLIQVAEQTRIRRAYLAAIEDLRLDELPSRPFTIGYVRAYALALGLDGEAAVARFKADEPLLDDTLRAPVGVNRGIDPRVLTIVIGGLLIIAAIIIWNIAQRSLSERSPQVASTLQAAPPPAAETGPVRLGAPLPAPVESTIPPAYETPGLAAAMAAKDGTGQLTPPAEPTNRPPPPTTFVAQGPVYGAAEGASPVIFQARKSTALIVRGLGGEAYFARQLAEGEAYRAPNIKGLTIEALEPGAVQIFVDGQSRGLVPVGVSKVVQLTALP